MKPFAERTKHFKESIFSTITRRAIANKAVNLGQGFPDFDGPQWLKDFAKESFETVHQQYAPLAGLPSLRNAVKSYYNRFYDLDFDSESEITITHGATQAIFHTISALVNPGDEVIVFEPFYDSYVATIEMCGGVPVPVTLKAPDFKYSENELQEAFSSKTKLVIFNNPHNPTGRVFNKLEKDFLCQLICQYDAYLLSDEVYEFLTFDGQQHIPTVKTLEQLKERTITISSVGKTFGFTGWKLGWVCTSKEITNKIRMIHQFNTFSTHSPLQDAAAKALNQLESYLPGFRELYHEKRELLYHGLKKLNLQPSLSEGTYFLMCKTEGLGAGSALDVCLDLIEKKGVATIPPSVFYLNSNDGENYLRFCFAKENQTLEKALQKLA